MTRPPFGRFLRRILVILVPLVTLGCQTESKRPNVLLISLDTLRADHLSCYGYHRQTSPFLDELASRGVRFANAFINTLATPPSHATILSSQYQESHRVDLLPVPTPMRESVPKGLVMLQEILRGEDYITLAVTGGGLMAAQFGFNRGFTKYDDTGGGIESETRSLLNLIRQHQQYEKPILAFLHTYEIHYPYAPPLNYQQLFGDFKIPFDGEKFRQVRADSSVLSQKELDALTGLYDGEIRYTDDTLRSMFGELEALGFLDNCLVVITSDHGEEFGEHGHLDHLGLLYDELLHIPLILVGDSAPRGKVDERLVSTVDVLPTILGHVRIEVQHSLEGRDLLTSVDEQSTTDEAVFVQFRDVRFGIRTPRWKLIRNLTPYAPAGSPAETFTPATELYDLSTDPHEQKNVAEESTDVAKALEKRLWEWKDKFSGAAGEVNKVQLSEQQLEKLRSLGYLDASKKEKPAAEDTGMIGYSLALQESIVSRNGNSVQVVPRAMDGVVEDVREQGDRLVVRGWASDGAHRERADQVAVFLNGQAKHKNLTIVSRPDVSERFDVPALMKSGFKIVVPKPSVEGPTALEVRVFAISLEGVASELRYRRQSLDSSQTLKFGKR